VEGKSLWAAVVATAAAVIGLGTLVLYGGGPPPAPERPKPPPPPEALMNSELRYSTAVYQGLIEQDAKGFGVPVELRAPLPYFEEIKERRPLRPRAPIETPHLRLSLDVEKHEASIDGQRFAFDHLVLRIENRTPKFLAYRIETDVADRRRCLNKGEIPHNAVVIGPGQTLRRTECLFRKHVTVDVLRAEVMQLSALGAAYVSRLPAPVVLYDARTAAGHVPPKGPPCPQTFSWRDIKDGLERKEMGWRDVIDYYARHSCEEFSFFRTYRYRTDPAAPLPARPDF
jgi:hypothetical protein